MSSFVVYDAAHEAAEMIIAQRNVKSPQDSFFFSGRWAGGISGAGVSFSTILAVYLILGTAW
jgi:hypothetical protein